MHRTRVVVEISKIEQHMIKIKCYSLSKHANFVVAMLMLFLISVPKMSVQSLASVTGSAPYPVFPPQEVKVGKPVQLVCELSATVQEP